MPGDILSYDNYKLQTTNLPAGRQASNQNPNSLMVS